MNTALWIAQGFLALLFFYSGISKATRSVEWLVSHNQTGVAGLSYPAIRFIGIIEIVGVFGLVLPALLNILPVLTTVSAIGFAIIMLLAMPRHCQRKEYKSMIFNALVFSISVFVAVGRLSF